jgi:carbonic anhydrase/acetyltransferase-like protein (isoleucine patch superfamily)
MMLKVKRTHIQDRCTVAFGATVMGGAVIESGTTLFPLSLVLKEMTLPTATYEGSPAEPMSSADLRSQSPPAEEAVGYVGIAERAAE